MGLSLKIPAETPSEVNEITSAIDKAAIKITAAILANTIVSRNLSEPEKRHLLETHQFVVQKLTERKI